MSHFGENQFPEFKQQSLAEACAGAQRPLLEAAGTRPLPGEAAAVQNKPIMKIKIIIIIMNHSL